VDIESYLVNIDDILNDLVVIPQEEMQMEIVLMRNALRLDKLALLF
jgi:hypothetical protein